MDFCDLKEVPDLEVAIVGVVVVVLVSSNVVFGCENIEDVEMDGTLDIFPLEPSSSEDRDDFLVNFELDDFPS